ncbi:MAG: polysaccharide deacetylase family protein [Burkholderiales bacterium]|nr:polysaccharide deacetylase family protein [Burkholderiales bacterium]MDE1925763.1 polysaccharide deacetylase family protein [Burkholderiales bacterium]MDE2158013.1 polysaccharide deacetylase family protein [Burkholderiales bacterium]MDE2504921.1 polysaccharide deacetylase family protein [Burkholderiales bacterium]
MGVVAAGFNVLALADAVRRIENNTLPGRALCITFDDGYADNHDLALPVLLRHGLTACFFIATGFLDGGRMFNDTVIEAVRRSPLDQVDLTEMGLDRAALTTPAQRSAAIGRLLPSIKYLRPEQRPQMLERLVRLLRSAPLPDDLMMTAAQVGAMHRAGMEIGAHTVNHPILALLDVEEAEREMAASRDELEQIIDAPVTLFAYPNGQPDRDYDARHALLARRLGYAAAVTTAPGVAGPGADRYQLPRYTPWNPSPWLWATKIAASRTGRQFATAAASSQTEPN